ncbi:nucleoside ABC transporter membrane protein [Rhizobium subbaraonis]|uniref:Nucleoside ABC transporter membrane protein n=1 Tax=Rhizobium subbaraonis TaxID=908946 RepID=A0A285UVL8_9HYPH|nr:ABC transporter permease [Rhizobium subbaraonis]SOC45965.1 nucleoside ABC transporter membrane protein [Rhizobium subbaraonis]
MLDAAFLVRRQQPGLLLSALSYTGGLAFGLAVSAMLLVQAGVPASALVDEFLVAAFLTSDGLSQTVTAALPLILVGLASAVATRVRFWNIGVEGQLWLGAVAATWVALHEIGPESMRLPLAFVLAALAGSGWIAISLVLKQRWGVNEVISSLLLGSVAFLLVQHLLFGIWRDPANSFPVTAAFPPASRFSALGWGQLHAGLFVAALIALAVWFLLERTRAGFYADAVGLNRQAALATGLPVRRTLAGLVLLSGALSGLAGMVIVSGTEHRLNQAVGNGYLFSAIVIAYLARAKPFWVVVVALALGAVFTAGNVLKVFYGVSEGMIVLVQGTVLISILMAQFFSTYSLNRPS